MFSLQLLSLARDVVKVCEVNKFYLSTAESCTGGLIAGCITEIPGASDILHYGLVAYANEAKTNLLGVKKDVLLQFGAVSEEVSKQMAEGALALSNANISVSVTGIAGPDGGTKKKPVGLVHFSIARRNKNTFHDCEVFEGNRSEIRMQTVEKALELIIRTMNG